MLARLGGGRNVLLHVLFCVGLAGPASAASLVVTGEDGRAVAAFDIPEGQGWCLLWNHSVAGFTVTDCYVNSEGRMILKRSHLPDFAAGLDHIIGRGRQVSDGRGGYWIEDLDEPVPGNAYVLRTGGPNVDHRLRVRGETVSLSSAVGRARVTISLRPKDE